MTYLHLILLLYQMGKKKGIDYRPKHIIKQEAEYYANQQKYIDSLQRQCTPGLKLMTCPTCGHICIVPEAYVTVTCIRYGNRGSPVHPGAFHPTGPMQRRR